MAEPNALPKFTIVRSGITIELNLDRFSEQFQRAQWFLSNQVLHDCRPFMPFQTGSLSQRSYADENRVVFPGPYARYLYMGKVMVDSVTGKGPRKIPDGAGGYVLRFMKGATLVPTSRRLNYSTQSNPGATDHWFDAAKAQHGEEWIARVKEIAGGGE